MSQDLQQIIEQAWEQRAEISPATIAKETREAIEQAIQGLDAGHSRVAEKTNGQWQVHQFDLNPLTLNILSQLQSPELSQ